MKKVTIWITVLMLVLMGLLFINNDNEGTGGTVLNTDGIETDAGETMLDTNEMESDNEIVNTGDDNMVKVKLETNKGDIVIEMANDMPITTGNFVNLVESGTYDGVIFHRIIDGFMIQGGDPTGTGMGDPNIPDIKDEFTDHNKNDRGTISMANAGPNTGSSQFFINLVNNNFLDTKHPAFGKVVEGMEVVDTIAKVETNSADRPIDEVKIIKATVL